MKVNFFGRIFSYNDAFDLCADSKTRNTHDSIQITIMLRKYDSLIVL